MANISPLDWLKRDQAVVLNWTIDDVTVAFVHKSVPHKKEISLFEPGAVSLVFLVADETVIGGDRWLNLWLIHLGIPSF